MPSIRPCFAAVLLFAWSVPSVAAGIECHRAASPAERAVCQDDDLRQLDARLSAAYRERVRASADKKAVQAGQRAWIKDKEACDANTDCLMQQYLGRIAALRYTPDAVDLQAATQLKQAIERQAARTPEFAVERTLEAFTLREGLTHFENVRGDSDKSHVDATFPTVRPAGVSPDEWQALRHSKIDAEGEHGNVSYTLLDLDGDGLRDLIVDAYIGGTGLFNYVSVMPRRGERFAGGTGSDPSLTPDESLYDLNGRGGNQSAYWIRMRGRVYAAWVDGNYGADSIHLLNPLHAGGLAPRLTVTYRYELIVEGLEPAQPGAPPVPLEARLRAALTRALAPFSDGVIREVWTGQEPLCPVPPGVEEGGFLPPHYSFQVVGDLAVRVGEQCHLGRLINWFGRYGPDGLYAHFLLKRPGQDEGQTYVVQGRRRLVNVVVEPAAPAMQ